MALQAGVPGPSPGYNIALGTRGLIQCEGEGGVVLGSPTLKPLPTGPEDVEKTLTQLSLSNEQVSCSQAVT